MWVLIMWIKVAVDVVHMPPCQGKHYLVAARKDFSGWVKVRALSKASATQVAWFLWEDIKSRHRMFGRLIVDSKGENKTEVIELTQCLRIKCLVISVFYFQANRMVEQGHKPIVDALTKMTNGGLDN